MRLSSIIETNVPSIPRRGVVYGDLMGHTFQARFWWRRDQCVYTRNCCGSKGVTRLPAKSIKPRLE